MDDELKKLARDAQKCRRCELYAQGTQTVFGRGSPTARLFFVGEQPGDQEDRQGIAFVGPAGKLLQEILDEVGIDSESLYITNAVKHFRWEPQGKRRIHLKPSARHVKACHVWLEAELENVQPQVIVCLGVTAGQSVLERPVTIRRDGFKMLFSPAGIPVFILPHPSAVLRQSDREKRLELRNDLARGIREAWEFSKTKSLLRPA
jgi:uracil-DNA glycosylase